MGEGGERGERDRGLFDGAEVALGVPGAGGGVGVRHELDFGGPRVAVGGGIGAGGDEEVERLASGHAEVGECGFGFGIVHRPLAEGARAAGDDTGVEAVALGRGMGEGGFDLHNAGGGGDPAEDGGVGRAVAGVSTRGREGEVAEGGVGEGGGGSEAGGVVFLFAGAEGSVGERREIAGALGGGVEGAVAVVPAR